VLPEARKLAASSVSVRVLPCKNQKESRRAQLDEFFPLFSTPGFARSISPSPSFRFRGP